ncbi:amino acid ABC transporter permease [Rhizobium sp. SIMBA_035]
MTFDSAYVLEILTAILKALPITLLITLAACIGASLIGFILEIARRSNPILRYPIRFLVDSLRSTPALVQVYFFYFVLPVFGITLPGPVVGVLALSLYYSGYLAEVFKAGIDKIPAGQSEAAQALGLGGLDMVVFVIAPQMLRNVAAPMGSYFISILKSTPYLAVIGVPELMGVTLEIASDSFRYSTPMVVLGVVFFAIAASFAAAIRLLEKRLLSSSHR